MEVKEEGSELSLWVCECSGETWLRRALLDTRPRPRPRSMTKVSSDSIADAIILLQAKRLKAGGIKKVMRALPEMLQPKHAQNRRGACVTSS